MNKIYMFDVDGVLADFDLAFTMLAHNMFGTPISSTVEQKEWSFRTILSSMEQSAVWDVLKKTSQWWISLDPLVSTNTFMRINHLCTHNEVYFITNRMHDITAPGIQTQAWLIMNGITFQPRVVVTKDKGEACKILNIDYSLEDNWGNACAIHWMSDTKSYLIERRYNSAARGIIPGGITRVRSVDDFLGLTE
ncbi:hypothetical protein LCGC14_2528650 [marine sediment metagenome]|uniref:Uncharacterized protein n=1 Tax=marine sediment metagenome TaxID=412755 RepID=A0A0F9AU81_9ZZZZ